MPAKLKKVDVVVDGMPTTLKLTDEQAAAYQRAQEQGIQVSTPPAVSAAGPAEQPAPPEAPETPEGADPETKKRSARNKSTDRD